MTLLSHLDCRRALRESTLSLPQIGRLFDRDHTTILHTRRVVENKIRDDVFAARIETVRGNAFERWRKGPAPNAAPTPIPLTVKKPARPSAPVFLTHTPTKDEFSSREDDAVRRASARLLELLREHHPEYPIRKTP